MKTKRKKSARILIILECSECPLNLKKYSSGISRYYLSKNRKNNPEKLENFKHCKYCNKHTLHKEIK